MGDARIDAMADRMMDEHVAKNRHAALQIARWALDSFDAVSASECDALRDELGIAQERGDGWRSIVKEDTIELERLRASASECEKLKAALRALLVSHWAHHCSDGVGGCTAVSWEKFCDAWDVLHPDSPSVDYDYDKLDAAARALVGSAPRNEADE